MALKDLAKLIQNATKEKPIEQDFLFMLNDTISRSQKPRQPSQTYKPSSLGGCMRRLYFEVTGAEVDEVSPPDPSLVGINESGSARHEHIQKHIQLMKDYGYEVEWLDVEEYLKENPQPGTRVVEKKGMETKLFNDVLNLSFMCDGIIKVKGVHYILEIKTETSFKWQKRTEPEDKHLYQAASYSLALGVSQVLFLYENRDICAKKVFVVEITPQDREEKVMHRIETCNSYIQQNIVPDMTEDERECRYCPFTEECRKW